MPKKPDNIDLDQLSQTLREARERKGWTLEQLSHELWDRGLPTAQNKLWRLENNPPKRLDTELLLWLERLLGVQLLSHRTQVLLQDVIDLLDTFLDAGTGNPPKPEHSGLHEIYEKALLIKSGPKS